MLIGPLLKILHSHSNYSEEFILLVFTSQWAQLFKHSKFHFKHCYLVRLELFFLIPLPFWDDSIIILYYLFNLILRLLYLLTNSYLIKGLSFQKFLTSFIVGRYSDDYFLLKINLYSFHLKPFDFHSHRHDQVIWCRTWLFTYY